MRNNYERNGWNYFWVARVNSQESKKLLTERRTRRILLGKSVRARERFKAEMGTWSEQYATRRELISAGKRSGSFCCTSLMARVLAASKQTRVASDAVVCITPPPPDPPGRCRNSSGKPIIFPSQFITIVSSSVHAGLEALRKYTKGGRNERETHLPV